MKNILLFCSIWFLFSCNSKSRKADFILYNARIYTVDSNFNTVNALVVSKGRIVATGNYDTLKNIYRADSSLDAGGKAVYPGFVDAHAHFYSYGKSLQTVNLVGTQGWEEILDSVKVFSKKQATGWLIGRGWDQNHWLVKEFPNKRKLDSLFPNRPVSLGRIDGHALLVNQTALNLAHIKPGQTIPGGLIETQNGVLTGILVDNAESLINKILPKEDFQSIRKSLLMAQAHCFSVGLTTVDEPGLPYTLIEPIQTLQKSGELKMRIYFMLSDSPENYDFIFQKGRIKTDGLNVRSFKLYADGALGSRGACLLQPYSDKPGWSGFLLSKPEHFEERAKKIYEKGFQMNTHAIGDSANRTLLKIYAKILKGKNDRRWRLEHAQIISPEDMHYFGDFSIIPSVQPTHATSDMFWALDRLGSTRISTAYPYKSLMNQNGWIPLGTDFPVENINPLYTFYSAVIRKDFSGKPESGFQMENALNRIETLKGMTIWAAKANFEENEKGSLEPGKFADMVILDQDIMQVAGKDIPKVKVYKTFVNGNLVFSNHIK